MPESTAQKNAAINLQLCQPLVLKLSTISNDLSQPQQNVNQWLTIVMYESQNGPA
jgi:hypothetical protein